MSRITTRNGLRNISNIENRLVAAKEDKTSVIGARRALAPSGTRYLKPLTSNTLSNVARPPLAKKAISKHSVIGEENAVRKSKNVVGSKLEGHANSRIPVKVEPERVVEKEGFSSSILPPGVENIDASDGDNVMLATELVNDIYSYLRKLESEQSVNSSFLSNQREIQPKMRSMLVDWLVNVHHQFRLLPETLYMGISIMDRFFQHEAVAKDKLQLVGVAAFFIASKYEEIYPPAVAEFVDLCDQLYSKRDVLKMEMVILRSLRFELGRPLPLHFLRRNSKAAHADAKIHTMAKYLMELTLLEHSCSPWNPSLLAATALYVTLNILSTGNETTWNDTLAHYSNYSERELQPSAAVLCMLILRSDHSKFQNINKKYASSKLQSISQSPLLKCDFVKTLAAKATAF